MRRFTFSFIGLCLCGLTLKTAQATPPKMNPVTALCGARVIDGRGKTYDNAVILIQGEDIRQVGIASQVHIPPGARIISYQGKTIMPGIVADHSHVGIVDGASTGPDNYNRENILRQLRQYEAYGVTTVTALGLNDPEVFYPLRQQLHLGHLPGADLFGADKGLGEPGGAPPVNVSSDQIDRPSTVAEARNDVQAAAWRKTDLIKLWLDDFGGTLPAKLPPGITQAIIEEAHLQHLRAAGHIFKLQDAKTLVSQHIDILAHGVRDQALDEPMIAAMLKAGTWCIPTIQLDESFYIYAQHPEWMNRPFFRNALQPALQAEFDDPAWRSKTLQDPKLAQHQRAVAINQQNVMAMVRRGARVGFGTDSGANPLRIPGFAEHREMFLLQQAGLTPMQVIELATSEAATLLAQDDRGAIGPGLLADLVVLDADPSVDVSNAEKIYAVWHRGHKVSGSVEQFTP